jgi:hypothetical protein
MAAAIGTGQPLRPFAQGQIGVVARNVLGEVSRYLMPAPTAGHDDRDMGLSKLSNVVGPGLVFQRPLALSWPDCRSLAAIRPRR